MGKLQDQRVTVTKELKLDNLKQFRLLIIVKVNVCFFHLTVNIKCAWLKLKSQWKYENQEYVIMRKNAISTQHLQMGKLQVESKTGLPFQSYINQSKIILNSYKFKLSQPNSTKHELEWHSNWCLTHHPTPQQTFILLTSNLGSWFSVCNLI